MASKRKTTSRSALGLAPGGSPKSAAKAILPGKMPKGARVRTLRDDVPEPYTPPDEHNVSMRRITNGYLVRQHGYEGGKRFEHEQFSDTKPSVQFDQAKREARLKGKAL